MRNIPTAPSSGHPSAWNCVLLNTPWGQIVIRSLIKRRTLLHGIPVLRLNNVQGQPFRRLAKKSPKEMFHPLPVVALVAKLFLTFVPCTDVINLGSVCLGLYLATKIRRRYQLLAHRLQLRIRHHVEKHLYDWYMFSIIMTLPEVGWRGGQAYIRRPSR